jgi:alkanesulfonate monooxygenase SsuD/methylene tetrahydromethanopterin reductase-like flavin-dependent oxidoreductase (luciferase family)
MLTTVSCAIPPFAPFAVAVELAQLADQLGYDALMFSHIAARDSFTLAAAVAQHTERIALATSVAPLYHRSPASMAQTAATVDDVSGGRFRLGLGVGHRVTMSDWHGQEIGTPTVEMREYVSIVRAILRGEPPEPGTRWTTTFAFMGFTPRPDIPIYQAALSPAMLRLAGELSDGVILWATPAQYVRDVVVPEVTAGRARAGKSLKGFEILAAVPSAVTKDLEAARAGIRAELHRYFGLPFYRAMFEAAGFAADIASYDAAAGDVEAQRQAIGDDFIAQLCAIGTDADVRAGVRRYIDAGATNPVVTTILGTDATTTLRTVALDIGLRPRPGGDAS